MMTHDDNFFLDNQDLQFRLSQLDLSEIVEIKENGYPTTPSTRRRRATMPMPWTTTA